jgi:hypothetical protein|tara:strand:- start:5974 stop:6165 length:192 start_codon:yes stop_codon:yes gene_type:complete
MIKLLVNKIKGLLNFLLWLNDYSSKKSICSACNLQRMKDLNNINRCKEYNKKDTYKEKKVSLK